MPCLTAAAATTSSWLTAPTPVMTTLRAAMIGVKYRSRPSPTNNTTRRTVHTISLRPRTAPRPTGLASSVDLPCARLLASRLACSIATARVWASRRASRSRLARRRGPSKSCGVRRRVFRGRGLLLGGFDLWVSRRLGAVLGLGHGASGFGSRRGIDRLARAAIASTISGPRIVTSPAPIVTTTSPLRTASATCSATAEKSGR